MHAEKPDAERRGSPQPETDHPKPDEQPTKDSKESGGKPEMRPEKTLVRGLAKWGRECNAWAQTATRQPFGNHLHFLMDASMYTQESAFLEACTAGSLVGAAGSTDSHSDEALSRRRQWWRRCALFLTGWPAWWLLARSRAQVDRPAETPSGHRLHLVPFSKSMILGPPSSMTS